MWGAAATARCSRLGGGSIRRASPTAGCCAFSSSPCWNSLCIRADAVADAVADTVVDAVAGADAIADTVANEETVENAVAGAVEVVVGMLKGALDTEVAPLADGVSLALG